ncbi:histidine kinase [candidate division KSB1 bacterium]|nr:histidine kinase [candidate division KSB1 bacterium]NIR69986.1 histidine kinase [candidate division KSB1 bacterium]NIS23009.1 histidine kinase [candidate division KSB1 bacterium]NIT69867.1 histidine kinase [candidate division KSB1 bacterium]NIU23516.1 histidine kinase [candidate division KSB1 bacterium]
MRYRIRNILLVSSLYDLFLFEEDDRLYEMLREEYQLLNLSHAPDLSRVSSGREAIELAKNNGRFDLIITTLHIDDMQPHVFAKLVRESKLNIPIILLAYDHRELSELLLYHDPAVFDEVFVWQGDFRLIIAIIKHLEDKRNVDNDTRMVGVQSIILIEDRVRYYSSFLPIIYLELFKQSQRLISEGINLSHRFLRMRARPKILLCTNYEEAWHYFSKYQDYILGVISDVDFKHQDVEDPEAGLKFARNVKRQHDDIPILLQSDYPENEEKAYHVGASFLYKKSPTLLKELREFMSDNFGFGDFIFRTQDRKEVGRAHGLKSLEKQLKVVPEESIRYHAERNHFSNWLKARTEFGLAHKLRPRKVSDFPSIQALRELLISSLREYRKLRQRGIITDFDKETFFPLSFSRIGRGSLGGKARGLSFVNKLIYNYKVTNRFENVTIFVPPAIVLATEVFDQFLELNNLHNLALKSTEDKELTQKFLRAKKFPKETLQDLTEFLEIVDVPLAVRSSSLLEDSQYYPFAGVYRTYMLPNNHPNLRVRVQELLKAIKLVYASTFHQGAKNYFKVTSYRLEEEKMAVVIQKLVGKRHDDRFYPDFAGVAKSYNFYPVKPQKSEDGIASVALGLGKQVVDGGVSVKFCPKYPQLLPQFGSIEETLKNSQQTFYALNLDARIQEHNGTQSHLLQSHDIQQAEKDDTLKYIGSTYSHENHTIYDGISRQGHRLVTFSPILKLNLFPLPQILDLLLEIGSWAMGTSVEIEFAVNMSVRKGEKMEFGVLQMRPLVLRHEFDVLDVDHTPAKNLVCRSQKVLGNGVISDICDIVVVDSTKYKRLKSRDVAKEVSVFNQKLISENRPYLLFGVGRWGSLDPLLGIPVRWEQISGAKVIVEADFRDFNVTPSQGSHFFHNLTSFRVGYFTISSKPTDNSFIDWDWLLGQPPAEEMNYTRLIRLESPVTVKINGRKNKGIILKPGRE